MGERTLRWTVFAAMVAAAPALYFLFVVGGLLPLSYIAWMTRQDPSLWVANLIHLVLWSAVFYGAAWLLGKALVRLPVLARAAALVAIVAGLAWVASQPIYGMGHNAYAGVNLWRLFFPEAQEPPRAISAPSPAPLRAAPGGEQRGLAVPAR